jgi:hypothetical protein
MGLKQECVGIDSICLSQDRNQWQTLVNAIMNLWVHKGLGILLVE